MFFIRKAFVMLTTYYGILFISFCWMVAFLATMGLVDINEAEHTFKNIFIPVPKDKFSKSISNKQIDLSLRGDNEVKPEPLISSIPDNQQLEIIHNNDETKSTYGDNDDDRDDDDRDDDDAFLKTSSITISSTQDINNNNEELETEPIYHDDDILINSNSINISTIQQNNMDNNDNDNNNNNNIMKTIEDNGKINMSSGNNQKINENNLIIESISISDTSESYQEKNQEDNNEEINTESKQGQFNNVIKPVESNLTFEDTTKYTSSNESILTTLNEFGTVYPIIHDSNAPGENGQAFVTQLNKLTKKEREEYDEGWKKHQFNLFASDRISVRRSIPDKRSKECKTMKYPRSLSDISVIIVFHNEAWSTLLRSVHSIFDRSPPELVREVILVDDGSTFDYLKEKLENYMKLLPKVQIKRTRIRVGLMKARILGASNTIGDVLVFLDAHIECYPGWLEPMLARITENETNVVCPVIDSISDSTFQTTFLSNQIGAVGVFDWLMQFNWKFANELQRKIDNSDAPLKSPAMAGGLFSIKRKFFYKLGTYDSGMRIWGSENVEMSFRIWMCGGQLEIIPCSHVGHVFRSKSPYSWDDSIEKILVVNQKRLVEVWLDDYKDIYYELSGNRNKYDSGNVSSRLELKKHLQCKNFQWYLNNIYPELYNPLEGTFIGYIESMDLRGYCLDIPNKGGNISLYQCHNSGGNQLIFADKWGCIRTISKCSEPHGESLRFSSCHFDNTNKKMPKGWTSENPTCWTLDRINFRINFENKTCLSVRQNREVILDFCDKDMSMLSQKWIIHDKISVLQNNINSNQTQKLLPDLPSL